MRTSGERADGAVEDLRIVPLADIPSGEVLELVRRSLGAGRAPRSAEYWNWKHRHGPFGASPGLAALDSAGRIVGLRTFLPWRWRQGSRTWRAVRAVDTATAPAWRRRGVFRRLTLELLDRVRRDGVAFVFNTPNSISLAGYQAMGWSEVGRVPLLARPLLPRPGRRLGDGVLEPARHMLEALDGVPGRPAPDYTCGPDRLETPIDAELLRWRYARPPGLEYLAAEASRGTARALVICQLRRRSRFQELGLVELLASPGDTGLVLAQRTLRRVLAEAPAHYAVASAPVATTERRLLLSCGLLPVLHRGPRLVVRTLTTDPELPNLTRWHTWRTALGDLELF